jgi:hypothetical protein
VNTLQTAPNFQLKGKAAEKGTTGDPKNQQASLLCHIPMRARVHDFAFTNFADPCKSGESSIPDSRCGCSTSKQMKQEHHDTDYEQNVN